MLNEEIQSKVIIEIVSYNFDPLIAALSRPFSIILFTP